MRTPGAHFAEAVGVRLNLPTAGARSVRIGAPIVLALGACGKGECNMTRLFLCANPRKLTDPAPIKEFSARHYFNNHFSASLMFVNTRAFTHRFRITFSPNLFGSS